MVEADGIEPPTLCL